MTSISAWPDSFGSLGALACAIHCAAMPLLLGLLPVLGLGFLASAGFERSFLVFATVLGLGSLWTGYRRHRVALAFALLVPGLLAICAAVWIPAIHESAAAHAIMMTAGGLLIAVAHRTNLSLSRRHSCERVG
jgi:hypothetical protein